MSKKLISISGPSLPFPLSSSAMVNTRDGKKVLLIGGDMDNEENFDGVLALSSYRRHWKWRTWNNVLNFGVQKHLAIMVPTGFAECGKKIVFKKFQLIKDIFQIDFLR